MKALKWLFGAFKPQPNVWNNVIHVIYPYKWLGFWVFDDERVNLSHEAFIAGADTFIDLGLLRLGIDDGHLGFRAIFASVPFPGHQLTFTHKDKDRCGNTYWSKEFDVEGWLCPALGRYFKNPPKDIYIKFEALPKELQLAVNPNPQMATWPQPYKTIHDARDAEGYLDLDHDVLYEDGPYEEALLEIEHGDEEAPIEVIDLDEEVPDEVLDLDWFVKKPVPERKE